MEKKAAVLMADLTGYTAMTDVHGGASAATLIRKYMELVDNALVGNTEVIQRVGDQVVLLADDPNDIVETAKVLSSRIHSEHHFLSIHAGIHYGSVFVENKSLFGSPINVASRIMGMAEQGQILCSSDLVENVNAEKHSCKHLGKFSFKNVMNEISVYEIITDTQLLHFIDPVCHMQIDPNRTKYIYLYKNREYHFCGDQCLTLFKSNPETFLD
jgi:adenylate cyclase